MIWNLVPRSFSTCALAMVIFTTALNLQQVNCLESGPHGDNIAAVHGTGEDMLCDAACQLKLIAEKGWEKYLEDTRKNISIMVERTVANLREAAASRADAIRNQTATEGILNGLKVEIDTLERTKTRLEEKVGDLNQTVINLIAKKEKEQNNLDNLIKSVEQLTSQKTLLEQAVQRLEAKIKELDMLIEAKQAETKASNPFAVVALSPHKIDPMVFDHVSRLQKWFEANVGSMNFMFYFMCTGWALCIVQAAVITRLYPYYRSAKFLTKSP